MLVINIKISSTNFGSLNHHQPIYKYNNGTFSECILWYSILFTHATKCVQSLNVPVLFLFGIMMAQSDEICSRNLLLITNMCCVYWLNKLLNLLLFGNRVSSNVFTCSGKNGIFRCIRIFELVNVGTAEFLLALNVELLLCLLFSLFPLGFCFVFSWL